MLEPKDFNMKQTKRYSIVYPLQNQNGVSLLLSLMILILICTGIQLSGFDLINESKKNLQQSRLVNVRDELVSKIERYSTFQLALRNSLLVNTTSFDNADFRACVLGVPAHSCQGDGQKEYPLAIYDLDGSKQLRFFTGAANTVNPTPAKYDTKGNLCTPVQAVDSKLCPFEVFTTFRAYCAVGTLCNKADSIEIQYSIGLSEQSGYSGTKLALTKASTSKLEVDSLLPPDISKLTQLKDIELNNGGQPLAKREKMVEELSKTIESEIGQIDRNIVTLIVDAQFSLETKIESIVEAAKYLRNYRYSRAEDITAFLEVWKEDVELAKAITMHSWGGAKAENIKATLEAVKDIPDRGIALGIASNTGNPWDQKISSEYAKNLNNLLVKEGINEKGYVAAIADNNMTDPNTIKKLYKELVEAKVPSDFTDQGNVNNYVKYYNKGYSVATAIEMVKEENRRGAVEWDKYVKSDQYKETVVTITGVPEIPVDTGTTTTDNEIQSITNMYTVCKDQSCRKTSF